MSEVVVARDGAGKEIRSDDALQIDGTSFRLGLEFTCGFMGKLKARITFLDPRGIVAQVRCDNCTTDESCDQCKRNTRKYAPRSSTVLISGVRFYIRDVHKTYLTLIPCGGKMLKQLA